MLLSFAPWLAIWILGGNDTFRLAAGVALVASVVLVSWEYLSGSRPKSIDWGSLLIIIGLFTLTMVQTEAWSAKWMTVVANGALFVLMLGTIVVGRPFAAEYGRDTTPEEAWETPTFKKITLGISLVWTAALGATFVGSIVTAVYPKTEAWSTWVVTVGALILATKFQAWYPRQVTGSNPAPAR